MTPETRERISRYEAAKAQADRLTRKRPLEFMFELTAAVIIGGGFVILGFFGLLEMTKPRVPEKVPSRVIYGLNGESKFRANLALKGE